LASLSIALYEAYLFVKKKNGVDGQPLAVKGGALVILEGARH
jgi:adenylyl- and sulfurtransferase ThiI